VLGRKKFQVTVHNEAPGSGIAYNSGKENIGIDYWPHTQTHPFFALAHAFLLTARPWTIASCSVNSLFSSNASIRSSTESFSIIAWRATSTQRISLRLSILVFTSAGNGTDNIECSTQTTKKSMKIHNFNTILWKATTRE
jgi:hypothetical protein